VRAAPSHYALPAGMTVLAVWPPVHVYELPAIEGLSLLMVWTVDGSDTWAAGTVLHCFRPARRGGAHRARRAKGDSLAVEFDSEPGVSYNIRPLEHTYSTDPSAPAGSWFLAGTPEQLRGIAAASTL
jgi:hypothetical protein